jgi:Family of unknown function (DUF6232)
VTIYYWSHHARVTDDTFESTCLLGSVILIRDLSLVHIARRSVGRALLDSVPVRICSGWSVGLPIFVEATNRLTTLPHWMPLTCFVVAGLFLAFAIGFAALRRPPVEIRAFHRGALICLFRTNDKLLLGQISRALLRVLERVNDER